MTDKALTITEKENRIAPWGNREELREIARRVQLMSPGGKKLDEHQALALAQGAVAHGLDPFNGEIWFIPGAGLMAGIKGLRKAARLQLEGNYWTEFEELRDPDQRALLAIPDGALAFRCIIRDSETLRAYTEAWAAMSDKHIPADMIPKILGVRPYVEGVGYFKRGESSKMEPVQVAMKRAEADALKRRFDLPFAVPSEPGDTVIEGDWSEAITEPTTSSPAAPVVPSTDRPYPPEVLRTKILDRTMANEGKACSAAQRGLAMGSLNECFAGQKDSDKLRHSVLKFLCEVTSGNDLQPAQVLALLDWLKPTKDSGGAYKPDADAVREAQGIVRAVLLEAGQATLFGK
jgi:hypothetical protein